jgi:hypothetical protein
MPKTLTKKLRLKAVIKLSFSPFTLLIFVFKKALPKVFPKIEIRMGSTIIHSIKLRMKINRLEVSMMKFGRKMETKIIKKIENKERSRNLAKERT